MYSELKTAPLQTCHVFMQAFRQPFMNYHHFAARSNIIQLSARHLDDHSDTDPLQRTSPNASGSGQLTYSQHQRQTCCQPYGASNPFTTYALPRSEAFKYRYV